MDTIADIVRVFDLDSLGEFAVLVFGGVVVFVAAGIAFSVGVTVSTIFRSWRRWRAQPRRPQRQ